MQAQPNPTPGFDLGKLPKEHIPLLLNSIVNEALLGFTRELVKGEWVWTAFDNEGQAHHELHDIVHNDLLAIEMLTKFGQAQTPPMAWQLNFIPAIPGVNERPMYQLYLLAPDANQQPQVVNQVTANKIGVGVALALCGVVQADLEMQHRTLFPGHYIAIAH